MKRKSWTKDDSLFAIFFRVRKVLIQDIARLMDRHKTTVGQKLSQGMPELDKPILSFTEYEKGRALQRKGYSLVEISDELRIITQKSSQVFGKFRHDI